MDGIQDLLEHGLNVGTARGPDGNDGGVHGERMRWKRRVVVVEGREEAEGGA